MKIVPFPSFDSFLWILTIFINAAEDRAGGQRVRCAFWSPEHCASLYENDCPWSFVKRDPWQTCQFINYDADPTKIPISDREWPSMDLNTLTLTPLIPGWKH